MQNQKGFILPIIITIVAVAILGTGGYFAYKHYSAPKPVACTMEAKLCPDGSSVGRSGPNCEFAECPAVQNPSTEPAQNEVASWKTYNENDFGFSFKYPNAWIVNDGLTSTTCCLNIFNYDPLKKQEQFQKKGEIKIQIANYKKSASMSLKEFVSSQTYMESNVKATQVEDIIIAGINGIKSNLIGDGTYYLPQSSTEGISITVFNHPESRDNFRETIDKMLSTFKFTTPTDRTAGWKTYTNTQYGFQIQYPNGTLVNEENINDGISVSFITSNGKMVIETEKNVLGGTYTPACNTSAGGKSFYKTINGINFTAIDISRLLSGSVSTSATEYCVLQNGTGYKLIPQIPYGNSDARIDVNNDATLNQMLSTFKFIK